MKKRCTHAVIWIAISSLAVAQSELPHRTWRSKSGDHQVEARLVEVLPEHVHLQRKDNAKVVKVPIDWLSAADQLYVKQQERQRAGGKSASKRTSTRTRRSKRAAPDAVVKESSGDWPTWRGPQRDGICRETGLLREWPSGGPGVVWECEGLGTGFSSVAVADGKVYTMGRENGQEYIFAVDEAGGDILWKTLVGRGGNQRGPNGTPTVADGRVYALSLDGELLCADAQTGKEIWRRSYQRDFGGRMMSGWGFSESPLVDGDRLVCTPGGSDAMMAALDAKTGRTLWTAPFPGGGGAGYSSIVVSNGGGVKQYVQLIGRGVISVSDKGQLLWHYDRIANSTANIPTPLISGDYVFCSSGYSDGGSALLQIAPRARGIREVYYKRSNEVQNHHGGMILIDGKIFMGHGHNNGFPLCLDLLSGRDLWRPGRGEGSGSAAVAYADERLYFRYQNGVVALIEASPDRYRVVSTFREPNPRGQTWPHPVIANKRLYLRDQQILRAYDVAAQ